MWIPVFLSKALQICRYPRIIFCRSDTNFISGPGCMDAFITFFYFLVKSLMPFFKCSELAFLYLLPLSYGAKIRAPHALVMTFLFKSGSLREKLKAIAQATYTHSRNLAYFVFTYKGLMALQSRLQGKNFQLHSFVAACVGGWLVFGENNHINSQINMYLLSRFLFGLSRLAVEKGYIPEPKQDPFPIFAAVTWGIVLWLFEYHRHTLQPSLQSSMTYLYDDSNVWHDISDFLIYNKSNAQK
ncbi:peroxisomal membrane protein 4 isoform X1 [Gopherus evgoodei]|uniref:peroxisomal membrane protein 4 isoform X1 n=1 Tax=Gopherus evgoodei TaxID=1825980 RepID=UPI0011CF63ED|nr:peroxisomal membrane protein 4 isoform X1 [Gopherus evgoodei]